MINLVRTTLVDNNTWNNSHIAMVGKAMASNEDDAYTIMQELGVDYVLVIFGGLLVKFHYPQIFLPRLVRSVLGALTTVCLSYSGDDINKFLWMVRIGRTQTLFRDYWKLWNFKKIFLHLK